MRTVISHPSQPAPLNLMLLAQNDHKNMFCSNQVKKPQQLKIWDWLFASPWDKFPPPLFFYSTSQTGRTARKKLKAAWRPVTMLPGLLRFKISFAANSLTNSTQSDQCCLKRDKGSYIHHRQSQSVIFPSLPVGAGADQILPTVAESHPFDLIINANVTLSHWSLRSDVRGVTGSSVKVV